MDYQFERRSIFLAIGIGVIVMTPFLLIFLPKYIAQYLYLYNDKNTLHLLLPDGTTTLYIIGLLLLASTLILFGLRKWKFVQIITLVLSIVFFILSTMPYISIGVDGITYRKPLNFEKHQYHWEEMVEVIRYDGFFGDGFNGYGITFQNGETLKISEGKDFNRARSFFLNAVRDHGIEIIVK